MMMKSSFEKCIGTDKIDKQDLFDRKPEEEGHPKPNNTYIPFMATLLHLLLLQKVQAALKNFINFITPAFQSCPWTSTLSSLQLNYTITTFNQFGNKPEH